MKGERITMDKQKNNLSASNIRGIKVLILLLVLLQTFYVSKNIIEKGNFSLKNGALLERNNFPDNQSSPDNPNLLVSDTILQKKNKTPFGFIDSVKKKPIIKVNLNTADTAQLIKLYGIGSYFAKKIIEYRERLGGSFVAKEQLLEIYNFTPDKLERIVDKIFIYEKDIQRFTLEELELSFMEKHTYIGPYAARGIIKYIEIKRKNGDSTLVLPKELADNDIITPNNAERLNYYIKR